MTRVLNAERKEPVSGEIRSAVVFLHGYGANGADLLGLADPLGEHLPDTLFVAPDAPEACAGAPFGFQWFPIPWIDGSSEEESMAGMARAVDDLNAFLDALMVDEDLLPEQVVLFGFSQGTMMSLHVAPRREDPVAGLVAFSGWLRFQDGCWRQSFWQTRLSVVFQSCWCMAIRMMLYRPNRCPKRQKPYRTPVGKTSMPMS